MSVQFSDIVKASHAIKDTIIKTPILPDMKLSSEIGANAYLKAECLQRSGSFKIRGAYNKISRLSDEEKSRGVSCGSAGNHAQGVALAARLLNTKAIIVLPEAAPLTKVNATKAQGAEVILKGGSFDEAVAYSKELSQERGLTYINAFDDELIIAGQGTVGLEIVEDLPEVTLLVVPVGGGGIISGTALAVKNTLPNVRIVGVQAAHCGSINQSLKAGHPVEFKALPTIADGIAVKRPGELTLPIIKEYVEEVVEVTEEEIAKAIFHCAQNNHLVVEGAGAAGVAALMAGKIEIKPKENICTVLCGGNIDANLLTRILEQVLVRQGRYIMLKVLVPDRPGNLANLTKTVSEIGANVIEVYHRRAMWLAPLGFVGIEMLLEVRDEEHGADVVRRLSSVGYHVEREASDQWEI